MIKLQPTLLNSVIMSIVLFLGCQEVTKPPQGMLFIPEGFSTIGVDSQEFVELVKESGAKQGLVYDDAVPSRQVFTNGFYIDRHEVTNREYKVFCEESGHPPPSSWQGAVFADSTESHPVSGISWYSAKRYCGWVSKRLPSEIEWEKAARGFNGNKFPWGNDFKPENANIGTGRLVEVGAMKHDKSFFGVYDLAGNVMEWTGSWYVPYPESQHRSDDYGEKFKVVRGAEGLSVGHYSTNEIGLRSYVRLHVSPTASGKDLGFRCAMSPPKGL